MKTSIIGYPRIGSLRELKFATEAYLRNECSEENLQEVGKEIRKSSWLYQQACGIWFIPSNDFSFYDTFLDTAMLFNIIPKRYTQLGLSKLDTYFAMARGYQGEKGDVKALPMKKWFNTNYHYIVPELEDNTEVKLIGTKPFEMYLEAKDLGIETKPVIVGAFTLFQLSHYVGIKSKKVFIESFIQAYKALLKQANDLGIKWLQFDEPCLVYDLNEEDKSLFKTLYQSILSAKGKAQIVLQTYFGDIRDVYQETMTLPFDGIGLDFIEGKKTLELIKQYGFPKHKLLFAGVINGKNIWRNNYKMTLSLITTLKHYCKDIVLNTSCSLLHVPYTLKNETELSKDYLKYFSFAEEKLKELEELKQLVTRHDYKEIKCYQTNQLLFKNRPNCYNAQVQERTAKIKEEDFIRHPKFEEREVIQKNHLNLPLFPTTTIGSFPQTKEVKSYRTMLKKDYLPEEEYKEKILQKIKSCITLQEAIGLDVLVHGEYERNDMVQYFSEQLKGYLITEKAWVQSYGTRCVKPPIIWGDISREKPITVAHLVYAQSLTQKPVKGMLTGPVTMLNWSFPREDISLKESTFQLALAIRDEVLDLEDKGIKIIQIDEAALREKLPLRKSDWEKSYLDGAIPAFCLVHSSVKAETQIHTHMCYSEFTDIIAAISQMDADVITFEASRSNLDILDAFKECDFKMEVGPGIYDVHSPRIPTIEEMTNTLDRILEKVQPNKVWMNPDCGLKTREEAETIESLKNLVCVAKKFRKENR